MIFNMTSKFMYYNEINNVNLHKLKKKLIRIITLSQKTECQRQKS